MDMEEEGAVCITFPSLKIMFLTMTLTLGQVLAISGEARHGVCGTWNP